MKIFSADFVLPVSAAPIEKGAVAFENDRIVAVGPQSEIARRFPAAEAEHFGEAVIMPGLVNCHSHLEISVMRGFLDEEDNDFYSWLIKLTKTRAEVLSDSDIELSALLGALEGARGGVTCFGDIGRYGKAGLRALKSAGLRGIVFQETDFAPTDETADENFAKLKEKFLALRAGETDLVRIGLSPHAPYTVSRRLFELITAYALDENIKLTIHAAESDEEQDLMRRGTGFFAELYQKLGFDWRAPGLSSVEYLAAIGVLRAGPLLAHCVKVSGRDIELIKESRSSIAHCPKSNAKFGHGIAPMAGFLGQDICFGFGSDSVASNNVCDIFEEARFAVLMARAREAEPGFVRAEKAIETATLGGARALGLERETGSLEAGKQADLIVVSLAKLAQQPVHDLYSALLFATNARDVCLTMVAGEVVFRDGQATNVDEATLRAEIGKIGNKLAGC